MGSSEKEFMERIMNEIKKSGFLFELEVSKTFDKYDYHTRPNVVFNIGGKELEMDLIAYNSIWEERTMDFNGLNIACSCKKSRNYPWVFFLSPRKPEHDICHLSRFVSNHKLHDKSICPDRIDIPDGEKIGMNKFNINKFDMISKTYLVAFSKDGSKQARQIYDSVGMLMKYLKYHLSKEIFKRKSGFQKIGTLSVPMIAVDGDIFGVTEDKGKIKIAKKDWIPLIVESDGHTSRESLLIYVVSKGYLESFVKLLNEDLGMLDSEIKNATKKKIKKK